MAGIEREELRIALAMNGGVSLAVWIGGVTREFARLVSRQSGYGKLLDILAYDPRIDVIAGTSAGGVNGAYLAMALTHYAPSELDDAMAPLRSIWIDDGAIDQLLRNPLDRQPPSLLDGDGFYYGKLRDAFLALGASRSALAADTAPLDLILTTTLLRGEAQNEADDFGTSVPDVSHRGIFHYTRTGDRGDDFASPRIAEKLAVGARSTSSFPAAFEPSFCPVKEEADGRPDMDGIVNFGTSRFLIDGGILDNKPLDVALESIFRQKASRPARRVLAYIVPDPGAAPERDTGDDPTKVPALLPVVLASLLEIPTVQSVSNQLDVLRQHNSQVRQKRRSRTLITRHASADQVDEMCRVLFPAYRDERVERALNEIIDGLNTGLSKAESLRTLASEGRRRLLHDLIYIVRDLIPWVPRVDPLDRDAVAEMASGNWRWGTRTVQQLSRLCLDLIVRAEKLNVPRLADPIHNMWEELFAILADSDKLRDEGADYWQDKAPDFVATMGTGADPSGGLMKIGQWLKTQLQEWRQDTRVDAALLGRRMASFVRSLSERVGATPPPGAKREASVRPDDAVDFRRLLDYLAPPLPQDALVKMLAFIVVQETLGDEANPLEEEVEFIQITGDDDELSSRPLKAAAKLNGTQLAHFGAFYKSSWRANDWLWGRRDAVPRMLRLVLNAKRLEKTAKASGNSDPVGYLVSAFKDVVDSLARPNLAGDAKMSEMWSAAEVGIAEELAYVATPEGFVPESLPKLTTLLGQCFDIDILRSELLLLAQSVREDREDKRAEGPNARHLPEACVLAPGEVELSSTTAWSLRSSCNLGGESWRSEIGTDPATATVSKAVAIGIAALRGDGTGSEMMGKLLSVLRLPALLFYGFSRNLSIRSSSGVAADAVIGGAAVAVLATAALGRGNYPQPVLALAFAALVASLFVLTTRIPQWWLRLLGGLGVGTLAFAGAAGILLKLSKPTWIVVAGAEAAIIATGVVIRAVSLHAWLGRWRLSRRLGSTTPPLM